MTELLGTALPPGSPFAAPQATVDAIVVAAMDEEIAPFEQRAEHLSHHRQAGAARSVLATVDGRRLLLVRSGIGAVNAVTATTLAVHAVRATVVISAGSAGGLGRAVRVGDVVVGTEHAFAGADATAFGYTLGQIPGMPATFPASAALLDRAQNRPGVLVGAMLSGDSFVDGRTVEHYRGAFPDALTADMESTAIAQTCYNFDVPFLAVRGVSDLCGPDAGDDFRLAVDDVAALSADVVLDLIAAPVAARTP
ncbi:5'-methylthioadenosine/S-adenosylhomocysteine nucleosidase [Georgenia sunbinii]|uniref:5'-methylthioadenosine/S-adenosylhomocysteine nucleosidase n=1 Tax=Georgenia sunbinii TaxID=3117728 RepID=UPI002F267C3F